MIAFSSVGGLPQLNLRNVHAEFPRKLTLLEGTPWPILSKANSHARSIFSKQRNIDGEGPNHTTNTQSVLCCLPLLVAYRYYYVRMIDMHLKVTLLWAERKKVDIKEDSTMVKHG